MRRGVTSTTLFLRRKGCQIVAELKKRNVSAACACTRTLPERTVSHADGVRRNTRRQMVKVSDEVATEHLEVQTRDPDWFLDRLTNYGSLFLGAHSTVAYSDKAIGTNHVLPTNRAARYTGGLWVGKFIKTVTYQKVTAEGTEQVAPATAAISDAEFFYGHALTARIRQERVKQGAGTE